MKPSATAAAVMLAALSACGCMGRDTVLRVVDGQHVEGRYVEAEAYDAFVRGTIAEEDGDLATAAQWYVRAYEIDPEGVDPLARLGYVLCAIEPEQPAHADKVFAKALEIHPGLAVTWTRRARCLLRRGQASEAVRDAREAVSRDPNDAEAITTLADALHDAGRGDEAARVLDAWVLWSRGSRQAWRAVGELAARRGDAQRLEQARQHLMRDAPPRDTIVQPRQSGARILVRIDHHIARGDLAAARSEALMAGLAPSVVAVRACALGRWKAARQEAATRLAADPGDVDALAVLIALPGGGDSIRGWQATMANQPRPVSSLAALLIADALKRRVGLDAAQAFLAAYGPIEPDSDPLASLIRRRLGTHD